MIVSLYDFDLLDVTLFEAMELFFERSQTVGGDDHRTIGDIVSRYQVCQESDVALDKKLDGNFMVGCQNFHTTEILCGCLDQYLRHM